MFGYVKANKPELKIREYARYRGYYCGLCRSLKKKYGRRGQLTLSYDMTFLVIFLSSLYEPPEEELKKHCIIHPAKKQYMVINEVSGYAADMNILLTYGHLEDDWKDERKLTGFLGMKLFHAKKKKVERLYPGKSEAIGESLAKLAALEKENCLDIDTASRPFGELMAELFVWKKDAFESILRSFGFYLGKFIYILDAGMDVVDDRRKGCYNPFVEEYEREGFREKLHEMLEGTLRMAIAEFEKLPCEQDLSLLRNILYEGIWVNSAADPRRNERENDKRSI